MATETIEVNDTVRWVGKRTHWIVLEVDADTLTVWQAFRRGRDRHQITRLVARDRVELVRKGNRDADRLAEMDAHLGIK